MVALAFTLIVSGGVAAFATPVAAQESEDTLEVAHTYHYDPDDPDNVTVEATLYNTDAVDSLKLFHYDEFSEVQTDDFVLNEDAPTPYWAPKEDVAQPTMTVTHAVQSSTSPMGEGIWTSDVSDYRLTTNGYVDGQYVRSDYSHEAGNGYAFGESMYLGPQSTATNASGDGTITAVAPAGTHTPDSPQDVADGITAVSNVMEVGHTDHDVTAFARPNISASGYTSVDGWVVVKNDIGVHDPGSSWFHEYVHTTDRFLRNDSKSRTEDMQWMVEGFPEYGAAYYGLETGYNDFSQFEPGLIEGRILAGPANLSDPDTWGGGNQQRWQAPYVLAALDRETRIASDGQNTLEDIVARSYEEDTLDQETFLEIVGNHSNDTVRQRTKLRLRSDDEDDMPEIWNHSQHEDVFGPTPNVEWYNNATAESARGTTLVSQRTSVDLDTDQVIGVTADQTLTIDAEVEVENGDLLREDPREYYDHESRTIEFDGPETTSVRVNGNTYLITAYEADGTVLRGIDDHDDPEYAAVVTNETPELGLHAHGKGAEITVETLDGETVLDEGVSYIYGGTSLDPESDLEPGTTYQVTFEAEDETRTRYVASLPPVDGSVPKDVNGDGLYRDITGDGSVTNSDVNAFFGNQHTSVIDDYPEAYDYTGDGDVSQADVNALFDYVNS